MTDKINLDELRADMDAGTPGPWNWEVSVASKRVELCGGKGASDLTVMSFVRWGLQSAAPKFWFWNGSVSDEPKRADQCATPAPGREHHKRWFQRIDHPDARRIARVPELEQAYLDAIARAKAAETRAEAAEAERDRLRSLLRSALERDVSGKIRRQMRLDLAALKGANK
jgi:hypothetical protein